jgi:hypothetical protein
MTHKASKWALRESELEEDLGMCGSLSKGPSRFFLAVEYHVLYTGLGGNGEMEN